MVQDLVIEAPASSCPQIPEELFDYYSQLIENQVAEELAAEIIKTLQQQIRPEHIRQRRFRASKAGRADRKAASRPPARSSAPKPPARTWSR